MKKTTKSVAYSPIIPKTVSVREVQRTYRAVSDRLQREGTLMVMNYSEPDMVLLSKEEHASLIEKLKFLQKRVIELEVEDTLAAFESAEEERKAGALKVLRSLKDLR